MLIVNSIGLVCVFAILIYTVCFLCRYRVIPQSLSVTAEFSGRYYWWQVTICTVMGFLTYYLATVYPLVDYVTLQTTKLKFLPYIPCVHKGYGLLTMVGCLGTMGLGLAGYYSYSPDVETKRLLTIHKVGSFSGAVLLMLFYIIKDFTHSSQNLHWYVVLVVLAVCLLLGVFVKGCRKNITDSEISYDKDNSIVFWMEIGLVGLVSYDIIMNFIGCL